nr:MAG TPA: hypothetical protein [Caudoviricetes sp.]
MDTDRHALPPASRSRQRQIKEMLWKPIKTGR